MARVGFTCGVLAMAACASPSAPPPVPPGAATSANAIQSGRRPSEPWRPFADDSPWNQPLAHDAALAPDSPELLAHLIASKPGEGFYVNTVDYSIPVWRHHGLRGRVSERARALHRARLPGR